MLMSINLYTKHYILRLLSCWWWLVRVWSCHRGRLVVVTGGGGHVIDTGRWWSCCHCHRPGDGSRIIDAGAGGGVIVSAGGGGHVIVSGGLVLVTGGDRVR